jgi:hypothetical protein
MKRYNPYYSPSREAKPIKSAKGLPFLKGIKMTKSKTLGITSLLSILLVLFFASMLDSMQHKALSITGMVLFGMVAFFTGLVGIVEYTEGE